jgi:hypothetical protein
MPEPIQEFELALDQAGSADASAFRSVAAFAGPARQPAA